MRWLKSERVLGCGPNSFHFSAGVFRPCYECNTEFLHVLRKSKALANAILWDNGVLGEISRFFGVKGRVIGKYSVVLVECELRISKTLGNYSMGEFFFMMSLCIFRYFSSDSWFNPSLKSAFVVSKEELTLLGLSFSEMFPQYLYV